MDVHRGRARRAVPHDDPASLTSRARPLPPAGRRPARRTACGRAVGALPPRQREAVVLKYVADLDHPTIAAALGTSPAMSRRLVSDALATLRKDLP